MATKITDRHCTVHFYDLIIRSHTAKGFKVKSPSCAKIGDVLTAALTRAKGHELNPNAKVLMKSLDDVGTSAPGSLALLLNCADMTKPDPRFKDFKKKTLRPAGKLAFEAVTKSCHALLVPDQSSPHKALLVMTMRSGIQSEDIAELFNQLSLLASAKATNSHLYEFTDPSNARDENGKYLKYRVNYHFQAVAHTSENLAEALRTGTFKEMTLMVNDEAPFDQGGNLLVTQKSVTVKSFSLAPLSWNRLKQGISSYSNNVQNGKFDKVKVSYATREGEDKSTTMQINQLDQAFTRREHIVLGVHTPDCFGAIDQRIINDLHRLISES